MALIGDLFTAPVDCIETIRDENLKRTLEKRGVEMGLSQGFTFLWNLGKLPIVGQACRQAAMAGYLNWLREPGGGVLRITVPDEMNNPKNQQHFATVAKAIAARKGGTS